MGSNRHEEGMEAVDLGGGGGGGLRTWGTRMGRNVIF